MHNMQFMKPTNVVLFLFLISSFQNTLALSQDELINTIYSTATTCWSTNYGEQIIVEKKAENLSTIISARKAHNSFGNNDQAFIAVIFNNNGKMDVMEGLSNINRSGSFLDDVYRWAEGNLSCN